MLYTESLNNVVCQLYLHKAGKQKKMAEWYGRMNLEGGITETNKDSQLVQTRVDGGLS